MERQRLHRRPELEDDLEDESEEVRVNSPDTPEAVDFRAKGRSRLSNGATLLPGADGRSTWSRRFRDLIALHIADLGGEAVVSEAQRGLVRRVATLTVEAERLETAFATAGEVDTASLDVYLRSVGHLHRILATLGLQKTASGSSPAHHSDPTTAAIIEALRAGGKL